MTAFQAKKIVAEWLAGNNLPYHKLSARTVDFADLARGSKLFVKVHGWKPNSIWGELRAIASVNGFLVETDGLG